MTTQKNVNCDCGAVSVEMSGDPKVHAYCHCEDCRELLQVPYHSVLAWEGERVHLSKGSADAIEYQHPHKRMTRVFCRHCGDVLYNTNAKGWKLVSQLMYRKCNQNELPEEWHSNAHFFYDRRVIDIADELEKR